MNYLSIALVIFIRACALALTGVCLFLIILNLGLDAAGLVGEKDYDPMFPLLLTAGMGIIVSYAAKWFLSFVPDQSEQKRQREDDSSIF